MQSKTEKKYTEKELRNLGNIGRQGKGERTYEHPELNLGKGRGRKDKGKS